jgi:hemolysin III
LLLGWLCVLFPDSFLAALPSSSLGWLIAGGVFYTSACQRSAAIRYYSVVYYGERFNSISHLVGASLALVGGAVLITLATIDGELSKIVSYTIYAVTLFLLYLSSTLYHSVSGSAKEFLQKVDHQAIYLLIAGTYTPFIMVAMDGDPRWKMLAAVWGIAICGMILDALPRRGARILPVIIYLLLGWLCVLFPDSFLAAFIYLLLGWLCVLFPDSFLAALPSSSLGWLIAGGVFYTSGVIFFALDSWYPWCHGIWHLFVLAGSASHYIAVLLL